MRTTRKNVFLSTGSLVANAVRERRRYHLLMRAATGYVVKTIFDISDQQFFVALGVIWLTFFAVCVSGRLEKLAGC